VDCFGERRALLGLGLLGDQLLAQRPRRRHKLVADALHLASLIDHAHRAILGPITRSG
jgi:hypothetical protein